MNEDFDYTLDGTYVCVFCDNDVEDTFCNVCQEYKGIMTLREYKAYLLKCRTYLSTYLGA